MPNQETSIQADIREALGRQPDLVLWRNNVGMATPTGSRRPIHYGLVRGASDLIGILAPSGRFVAIEVKTDRGRVSPEQELFLALVRKRGGFAAVVRSPAEALDALERARNGADR